MVEIPAVGSRLRTAFGSGRTKPLAWRRAQLGALKRMLIEQEDDFLSALQVDLGKNAVEARRTEVMFIVNEVDDTLEHLDEWLAPQPAALPARLLPGEGRVVREPLGVVLIIGP